MLETEIRCPNVPNRLFMKMITDGEKPVVISGLNLMELACSDCARSRRKRGEDVFRVLHRYFINGELCESVIQYEDGTVMLITEPGN
jgi:hypothetical protein